MNKYCIPLLLFHLLLVAVSRGQSPADTIRPGKGLLMTGVLKPGLRQYLVYFQRPQQHKSLGFWYWMRDIRVGTHDGAPVFAITQHWYGSDTASYRKVYSLNAVRNFAPLYHMEEVGGKISAYDWKREGIKGTDSVEGNVKKGFNLDFGEANFNWNLDIETFEMLPLGAGKSFLINFYDAGLEPSKYVLYRVTGSEELSLLDGKKVACWKLYTEGSSPRGDYHETYWISKAGHEFLKEEDVFSGMYRYKVKLPEATPDILGHFTP